MADKRGADVEKWRLSDEQLDFQKKYKSLRMIEEMLKMETMRLQQEGNELGRMWQILSDKFERISIPRSPVKEMPGMDFGETSEAPEGMQNPPWSLQY